MDQDTLNQIFLPHLAEKMNDLAQGKRLVHYTSAEAAHSIINNGEVWLRNAKLMNDYSELQHGLHCLRQAWASECGKSFQEWLNQNWPNISSELQEKFDYSSDSMQNLTYMISLSVHDDTEDELGRLSMWRAYGGRTGVAIVMNPQVFIADNDEINVYSAPVSYLGYDQFQAFFVSWVGGILENREEIEQFDRDTILNLLFHTFRTFVLCTKHPGFREEREWRVFHTINIDSPSSWISVKIQVINGAPQHILIVNLRDDIDKGVVGLEAKKLINRLIIGPCDSPLPIRSALHDSLEAVGVENANHKIWMSHIPLRERK